MYKQGTMNIVQRGVGGIYWKFSERDGESLGNEGPVLETKGFLERHSLVDFMTRPNVNNLSLQWELFFQSQKNKQTEITGHFYLFKKRNYNCITKKRAENKKKTKWCWNIIVFIYTQSNLKEWLVNDRYIDSGRRLYV